ncbi:ribosomal L1 domain-containing protein CG13096 [Fopius arisanus]|nr:PREDICTED: ribosomal L1 domain-containing protein CG13096-like [Fopius arisanus]
MPRARSFSLHPATNWTKMKSIKGVIKKTKGETHATETKSTSTRRKNATTLKKDKSMGIINKKIEEDPQHTVETQLKKVQKKNKQMGKIQDKLKKVPIEKKNKMKNKMKNKISSILVEQKKSDIDSNEAEKISGASRGPCAPKSEVNPEKLHKLSKVKKRVAPDEASPSATKKLKTSVTTKLKGTKTKSRDEKKKDVKNIAEMIGDMEITKAHVKKCVKTVLQLAKKPKEGKKILLPEEDNNIFLQVTCIKIPKTPRRQLRVFLPNMMLGPTDEVALFVPDLEKGRRKDYEKTVDHWETILREKNVSQIKEIIPMNRVKTEFSQYEMKLKLGRLFDYFLVDGRIAGHMTHLLGKTFRRAARPPTPVKLQRDNLKSEIENALRKTSMEIHGLGNCHTMQVASVTMSEREIVENIIAACKTLEQEYPGGWENIRSITVKTTRGLAIPVYFSIKNKNNVPVTRIRGKRPKAFKTVEGELSTTLSDVKVQVQPGGRVILKKIKT